MLDVHVSDFEFCVQRNSRWGCLSPSCSVGSLPRKKCEFLWLVSMLRVKLQSCTSSSSERLWPPFPQLVWFSIFICSFFLLYFLLTAVLYNKYCRSCRDLSSDICLQFCSGFNVETVEYKNISFTVWDVGGQDKVCYIRNSVLIFITMHMRFRLRLNWCSTYI